MSMADLRRTLPFATGASLSDSEESDSDSELSELDSFALAAALG